MSVLPAQTAEYSAPTTIFTVVPCCFVFFNIFFNILLFPFKSKSVITTYDSDLV